MASWNGVITNAGNQLLTEWVNEKTLNFDKAAAGSGTVPVAGMMGQTSLVSQKQEVSLVLGGSVENGVRLKLQVVAPTTGYTLNQLGIWASVTGGSSVMIALYQIEDGVPIPSKADAPEFLYTFYAVISVSNEGEWSITVDPSAVLTRDMLGAASGVAPLDENAKIPEEYLPAVIPENVVTIPDGGSITPPTAADGGPYEIIMTEDEGDPLPAEDVSFDNEASGLTATTVQGALDELAQGLKDGTITSVTATATAAGWSGDIPVQTISVAGMTATSIAWVGLPETATAQQRDAARKAVMSPTAQGAGTITLTCDGAKPAIDIPIIVYLSGGAN